MTRRRPPRWIWFVAGCLFGSGATSMGLLFLFRLLEPPVACEAGNPLKRCPCPALEQVAAPWAVPIPKDRPPLEELEAPPSLRTRIDFWKDIWGKYPRHLYLVVDKRHPWIAYKTVDCRDLFATGPPTLTNEKACDERVAKARQKVVGWLKKQKKKPSAKVVQLFEGDKAMAKNAFQFVIVLKGQKDALEQAMERSQPYLATLEELFRAQQVPPAIARVAIIESMWNPAAGSSRGALGTYQFVAATAAKFLLVSQAVDERLDTIRSGWAAARYFEELHARFGSWPLALTAYNTGPTRMAKLLKQRKTKDLGDLANLGDWQGFGFDGQNYYAQLVAVVELTREHAVLPTPARVPTVILPRSMTLYELAGCLGVGVDGLVAQNPAWTSAVLEQGAAIPAGYHAALPPADLGSADTDQPATAMLASSDSPPLSAP